MDKAIIFNNLSVKLKNQLLRELTGVELMELDSLINRFPNHMDLIELSFKYAPNCKSSLDAYLGTYIQRWIDQGYDTKEKVLKSLEQKNAGYRQPATPRRTEMIPEWLKDEKKQETPKQTTQADAPKQEDADKVEVMQMMIRFICFKYNEKHNIMHNPNKALKIKMKYNETEIRKLMQIEELNPVIKKLIELKFEYENKSYAQILEQLQ